MQSAVPSLWVSGQPSTTESCRTRSLVMDASIAQSYPHPKGVCQECLLALGQVCTGNLANAHVQALMPACQDNTVLFFFDPSHPQMSSSLRCVLNTAKETVNSLHLFPVWSRWGCGAFRQSSSRKEGTGVLEGGMGVISIMHLRSLVKNCLVQQKRSTREHALGRPRLL